mgnify:CR=1 FL=1
MKWLLYSMSYHFVACIKPIDAPTPIINPTGSIYDGFSYQCLTGDFNYNKSLFVYLRLSIWILLFYNCWSFRFKLFCWTIIILSWSTIIEFLIYNSFVLYSAYLRVPTIYYLFTRISVAKTFNIIHVNIISDISFFIYLILYHLPLIIIIV